MRFLFLCGSALCFLLSCAGTSERVAFAELAAVEAAVYRQPGGGEVAQGAAFAADSAGLDAYLQIAALNNPELKSAFYEWKAALEKVPQARALPDPKFDYGYFIREVETRVGPQRQRFSIAQMFPWFGTLQARGDAALAAARAAQQRYEALRLKLFFEVKNAFYDYYYLGRAEAILQENIQLVKYLENVVLAKYRAGSAPHASLIKAQVELDKLSDRLRSLQDLHRPVQARLNQTLNRDPAAALPLPMEIPADTVAISGQMLATWLKEASPELKAAEFAAEMAKKNVIVAKKQVLPDFMLGIDYIDTDEARMPNVAGSGKDPVVAKISINLPLWFGKNGAVIAEAKARHLAAQSTRQHKENTLRTRLEMALYEFRDARRKMRLYEEALMPRARQALNVAQSAFEGGKVDFLDIIDAQRTLLEFELSYEQARVNYRKRLAELEMLTGRELDASRER